MKEKKEWKERKEERSMVMKGKKKKRSEDPVSSRIIPYHHTSSHTYLVVVKTDVVAWSILAIFSSWIVHVNFNHPCVLANYRSVVVVVVGHVDRHRDVAVRGLADLKLELELELQLE